MGDEGKGARVDSLRRRIVRVCVWALLLSLVIGLIASWAQAPLPVSWSDDRSELAATIAWQMSAGSDEFACLLPRPAELVDCGLVPDARRELPEDELRRAPDAAAVMQRVENTGVRLRASLHTDVLFIVLFAILLLGATWIVLRHPRPDDHPQLTRLVITGLVLSVLAGDFVENYTLLRHVEAQVAEASPEPDPSAKPATAVRSVSADHDKPPGAPEELAPASAQSSVRDAGLLRRFSVADLVYWAAFFKWLAIFALAGVFGYLVLQCRGWAMGGTRCRVMLSVPFFASAIGGLASLLVLNVACLDAAWARPSADVAGDWLLMSVSVAGLVFGAGLIALVSWTLRRAPVLAMELARPLRIADRRSDMLAAELGASPERPLIGLALSGGGIRSATFNLGVLSALERIGLLRHVDYVSTVSGGGYIGGFWTMWRHRNRTADGSVTSNFPNAHDESSVLAVRHLRQFSRFLVPRLGLLSRDVSRLMASVIGPMLPAIAAGGAVLLLFLAGWLVAATGVVANPGWALWIVPGLLGVLLMSLEAPGWLRRGRSGSRRAAAAYLAGVIFAILGAWLLWFAWGHDELVGARIVALTKSASTVAAGPWSAFRMNGRAGLHARTLPSLAWLAGGAAIIVLRFFVKTLENAHDSRRSTSASLDARAAVSAIDRAMMRSWLVGGAWALGGAIWFLGGWVVKLDLQAETVLGGIGSTMAFALARRLFEQHDGRAADRRVRSLLGPALPRIIGSVAVALFAVGIAAVLARVENRLDPATALLPVGTAFGVTVVGLLLLDPNTIGLHDFYRSRIARAFLGAANPDARSHRHTQELEGDDVPLDRLHVGVGQRPVHLICCCANDVSGDPLTNLGRGSESSVLSPAGFSVGEDWSSWATIRERRGEVPTLGQALTASAAAFNSLMGSATMELGRLVAFLMTTFNLRLGLWLPHPSHGSLAMRWPLGLRFYLEMMARARANGQEVHLSDGGHFENMAVFELLRRRVELIIAADCGADPALLFSDLANLVRRAREGLRVDIEIDPSPLRRGEGGLSESHVVVGHIRYDGGAEGVLVLLKPTLTGDESVDVQQYAARCGAFPHESTSDQFFDEAQWEAYRCVGEHTVESSLSNGGPLPDRGACVRRLRELHAVLTNTADREPAPSRRVVVVDAPSRD